MRRHRGRSSTMRQLAAAVGRRAAASELRWMRAAPHLPLAEMVARRVRGEPLQYILGTQPFGPLQLLVRPPTLIPRPETEDWTLRLARTLQPSPSRPSRLLDLCTGTGCIALLLCHLWPAGSVHAVGVDIAHQALDLARDNALHCGIALDSQSEPASGTSYSANLLTLLQADLLHPAFTSTLTSVGHAPFDLITCNPPYIPKKEYDALPNSVKLHEDQRALLGDPTGEDGDGLTFYRRIAELLLLPSHNALLRPEGTIIVEVGHDQASRVRELFINHALLEDVEVWHDPWGKARVVVGRR